LTLPQLGHLMDEGTANELRFDDAAICESATLSVLGNPENCY